MSQEALEVITCEDVEEAEKQDLITDNIVEMSIDGTFILNVHEILPLWLVLFIIVTTICLLSYGIEIIRKLEKKN